MATKLSVKLLVDKKSHKVMFAEAGNEFIDFLFNHLTLPLGSVTKLLMTEGMVGCIGRLYESVENLSPTYIQPNQNKNDFLNPKTSSPLNGENPPLLLQNNTSTATKKVYGCSCNYNPRYYTDVSGTVCRNCNHTMSTEITYVGPVNVAVGSHGGGKGGYVKDVVTYMVMDDLVVTPMSTISSIALLNKFSVKEVGVLEEKVVEVGMDEGLALLKASLESKTVLTDVFLGKLV